MENGLQEGGKWFSICLTSLLLATLAINLLSAYIRHQEAGLGCQPWPQCYAQVGALVEPPGDSPAAALTPTQTAKQAHRAIATGLVVLVLLVVYQARNQQLTGLNRFLPHAIVGVILLLSVIGPASYLKTLPAVATANLAGGMALLAAVWWLRLSVRRLPEHRAPGNHAQLRPLVGAALAAAILQILLGAWTSANFAASVCSGLLQCHSEHDGAGLSSFWYLRELALTTSGRIDIAGAQALIQQAHHAGAMLAAALLAGLGVMALRNDAQVMRLGLILLALLAGQIALGLAALAFQMPLLIVVAHNLTASLLLLCLLSFAHLAWQSADPAGDSR